MHHSGAHCRRVQSSAISGASEMLRPGMPALLENARRGPLKVVVSKALDQVSRNQFDTLCAGETASPGGYLRGMVEKAGAGEEMRYVPEVHS